MSQNVLTTDSMFHVATCGTCCGTCERCQRMERSRVTVTENRHNAMSCVCEGGLQISASTHQGEGEGEGLSHNTETVDLQPLRSVCRLSEATCNRALREAWRMWVGLALTSSPDNSKEIACASSGRRVGGGAHTGSNAGGTANFKVITTHFSTSMHMHMLPASHAPLTSSIPQPEVVNQFMSCNKNPPR